MASLSPLTSNAVSSDGHFGSVREVDDVSPIYIFLTIRPPCILERPNYWLVFVRHSNSIGSLRVIRGNAEVSRISKRLCSNILDLVTVTTRPRLGGNERPLVERKVECQKPSSIYERRMLYSLAAQGNPS